jgi:transposase-like protein
MRERWIIRGAKEDSAFYGLLKDDWNARRHRATLPQAAAELDAFEEGPWGKKFPTAVASWRRANLRFYLTIDSRE